MAKSEPKPETRLCSACKERPRVDQTDGATNTQCTECKYETQKRWAMSKAEQEEARAFHKGVEAMREFIASAFDKYGTNQKWTGPQFAYIVRKLKAPVLREASLPSPVAS